MPMPVTVEDGGLNGLRLVRTGLFRDDRGFFAETYSKDMFRRAGLDMEFVQDNLSESCRGTLRGMHYQIAPYAMGKLVRCICGSVFDVAVDLRRGSPSFGQWQGHTLSEENGLSIWIPEGYAHGFIALEDHALVHYKCTSHHVPDGERSLSYRCPRVNIQWPMDPLIVSQKDSDAPGLDAAEFNFSYTAV